MIRFLQKDSKAIKVVFWLIIGATCITMVVFLVPGILSSDQGTGTGTYASIRPAGLLGRYLPLGTSRDITNQEVTQVAGRIAQQRHYPQQAIPFLMPQAGQALIQREILLQQADKLGLKVTADDIRRELREGPWSIYFFPKGQFIGQDRYADWVDQQLHMSTGAFEKQLGTELEINRLESLITGGVFVSDKDAGDSYRRDNTKIKFDYAVLNGEDLRKQINPTDADLQKFFKENAARYKDAIPEARKISYIAFTPDQVPGGTPQITDQQARQYYQAHLKDYQVPDQVKVRHILISVPKGADAKTDAAAKAKADDVLKQLRAGGNWAALAKKYSDDPGSKDQGGELGFLQHGVTVPEFDKTAFSLNPGQISEPVKTQFGYHIIQTEEKQTAHTKSFDEVRGTILAAMVRDKESQAAQAFAQALATEAQKTGLAKTAAAHHLQVVATDYLAQGAIAPGLADSSKLLSEAFTAKKDGPPAVVSTGEGFAVFQVADIQAAHAPTFDAWKSHLVEDFRDQQLPQLLASKTNALAADVKQNGNLAAAAKSIGATVKSSDFIGRDGQIPDLGQIGQMAPQVFNLNDGQVSNAINTGRNGIVLKLTGKQEPQPADIAKNLPTAREQMANQQREEMFAVYVTNITQQYEKSGRVLMNKKAQQQPLIPG
ncbi:MAG TPA: peptidylprolyl isomerase [Acidobacteriaceae bacterium]|jgi:peptidyl-prolyl cis-trans isomerase D|nr:peptidylprolyl isomerase [Acidobacteriaceae bacterium]